MPTPDRRIVLVLGPGRSGTSTMAGTLALSGFDVPDPIEPEDSNPSGFYEPQWVVDFHMELLQSVRVRNLDSDPDAPDALSSVLADEIVRGSLRTWLGACLAEHQQLVIKDPRLIWFCDLWLDVATELGEAPGFVMMLRHPSEVTSSRTEFYHTRGASDVAGWVNVALLTERLTRGRTRALVHYSHLTTDWRTEAGRVRDQLGLRLDPAPDVTPHPVDDFIDPTLRRRQTGWGDSLVPGVLRELGEATFQALGDVADHGDSPERVARLDELREEYDALHRDALDVARSHIMRDRRAAVVEARRKVRAKARQRAEARAERRTAQRLRLAEQELAKLRARTSQLESSWVPGALRGRLSSARGRLPGRSLS